MCTFGGGNLLNNQMNRYPIERIRSDFPILAKEMNARPLIYFDNGATTQKPQQVIDTIVESYSSCNANVHRGSYRMSREATARHEAARNTVAHFIGAKNEEILFTSGGTESLNAIAYSYGEAIVQKGDNIVVTMMDHHSNFVPWQQLAIRKGASFSVIPLTATGEIDRIAFREAITKLNTRLVAFPHVSNVLGTINPAQELIEEIHQVGAIAVVDGAQAVAHMPVNVQELGADFYAFSSHKMYGPTGVGVLYGRSEILEQMPPFLFGGEMIESVQLSQTTFAPLPNKFEAGTPNFIGTVALASAINYIESIGREAIEAYEATLTDYALERLKELKEVQVISSPARRDPVISFITTNAHPYDVSLFLDAMGVALRSGHHCAEPLMHSLGLSSTLRISFGLYNTKEEIDSFIDLLTHCLAKLS